MCSAPILAEKQTAVVVGIKCTKCNYTGGPSIEICGALGEYGGGKTWVHMQRVVRVCLENPFIYGVHSGGDEPLTALVAPTMGDMKKTTLVQLFKALPDELIYKTRLYGEHQDIQLINGHRILLYSAEGAMNGPTLCQIAVDEIQEKIYDGRWHNLQGRSRDARARRLSVSASGIAERGHVEDIFRRETKQNRCVVMLYPEDNKANLARGYVEALADALPESRERDEDGWLLKRGAMYAKFSRVRHLRMPPGMEDLTLDDVRAQPVTFAPDFGRSAAVVFGVPITRDAFGKPWRLGLARESERRYQAGIFIVDQLMPDNVDAEELVPLIKKRMREKLWLVKKDLSWMCFDPSAESDQVREFLREFPGIKPIQWQRGFYHLEENGVRAVDRALLSKNQDTRLFVHPDLARDDSGRGVVEMFGSYLASKPKDKKYEHAADVVRYATQHLVPLPDKPDDIDPEIQERIDRAMKPEASALKESML